MSTPECVASVANGNVGLAFGIVTAAGLSTTIGAALAFVMPYSSSPKNLFLAGCLAIAAGVMIYVSFVEIFVVKAVQEFEKCFTADNAKYAYLYATLCFFGGIVFTAAFDKLLHSVQHWYSERNEKKFAKNAETNNNNSTDEENPSSSGTDTPTDQIDNTEVGNTEEDKHVIVVDSTQVKKKTAHNTSGDPEAANEHAAEDHIVGHGGELIAALYNENSEHHDTSKLIRMGIFAGIALAFHNFPEGLATFVAVLEDPSVGASVAIAIAIHNIPEGVCVAMPIYYATGSRFKAFFWATLSGMTELVGAVLGWLVLRSVITPTIYAILFGIVAGMMVYISLKELIPTAHRYDPDDQVTSFGVVIGMIIMAVSLVLFQF